MIPRTIPTWHIKSWQDELANLITRPEALLEAVNLGTEWLDSAKKASAHFPLKVTHSFASRIKPGDPLDPLLLQVLPLGFELEEHPGYSDDPLDESSFNKAPGLVHKYHNRALLVSTSQCAIHCRYCFRRNFPYTDNRLNTNNLDTVLSYLANNTDINEVILSGGDPLSLSDKAIAAQVEAIADIQHIKTLRVHSRIPIVLPSRITDNLSQALSHPRLKTVVVIHSNHAQELDVSVNFAIDKFKQKGFTLLNQSVLLRRINDNAEVLAALSERLFDMDVMPYYLHSLDKTTGTQHFEIPWQRVQSIYLSLIHI